MFFFMIMFICGVSMVAIFVNYDIDFVKYTLKGTFR